MNRTALFNRTYTRLVRKEVAEFARDERIEVAIGDPHGLVGSMLPLDEAILVGIMARCVRHVAAVEASRNIASQALGIPMWATLARFDPEPCTAPPRPVAREAVTCLKCAGTGVWSQKTARTAVDGSVTKADCYACRGKGVMTDADQRRNWGYHMFYYRLSA